MRARSASAAESTTTSRHAAARDRGPGGSDVGAQPPARIDPHHHDARRNIVADHRTDGFRPVAGGRERLEDRSEQGKADPPKKVDPVVAPNRGRMTEGVVKTFQPRTAWSLESRTTSCGSKMIWRWPCRVSSEVSSMRSWAAARPSESRGWRTDDSGTAAAAAKSMSSY